MELAHPIEEGEQSVFSKSTEKRKRKGNESKYDSSSFDWHVLQLLLSLFYRRTFIDREININNKL